MLQPLSNPVPALCSPVPHSAQEELPPQAELTVGGHNGFQAYKPIAGLLAASLAPPPSQEQFNGGVAWERGGDLVKIHIRVLIAVCAAPEHSQIPAVPLAIRTCIHSLLSLPFPPSSGLRTPDLDKFLPPRRKAVADPEAAAARISRDLTFLHHPIVDLGLPEPDM